MEIYWISIVLVSATIHPLRELLLNKASNPIACYLGVSVVWLVLATFQNIIVGNDFRIPGDCWPLIVISAESSGPDVERSRAENKESRSCARIQPFSFRHMTV